MSYANRKDGQGWRAVNNQDDVGSDETYSNVQPVITPSLDSIKVAAIAKVRSMRVNVFATLAGIQSQSLTNGDTTTAKAISGLQDLLKALPDIDLSNCKTEDDVNAAFAAAWMNIVKTAPASVASAFNEVFA